MDLDDVDDETDKMPDLESIPFSELTPMGDFEEDDDDDSDAAGKMR